MRLASIINCWADTIELLPYCIENHLQFCDNVIVVHSRMSNYGNKDGGQMTNFIDNYKMNNQPGRVNFFNWEPIKGLAPLANETAKRNYGLDTARKYGSITHTLIADADEMYIPSEMNEEKKRFDNPNLNGLVHPLKVYIKTPTLYCNDKTLVGGIQKLNKNTSCGRYKKYPFAYDSTGTARIDPSRRISYTSGIEMSAVTCHHFSYVRKDIDLKINNSSANLKKYKQKIYDDLRDAKPGYVSKWYNQELKETENIFNIPIW